jgi:UDP:flavonoid glycosyltransferase YjiC (YdhE family)
MSRFEGNCIAYFVSPHGYGHAARAAAVMEAMFELDEGLRFEVFTQVPRWFLSESLRGNFGYHSVLTDIGLVQRTPLRADLSATLRRLDQFLPLDRSLIEDSARLVRRSKCRLVVCDISPFGIAVGKEAGVPSVLVENFTWDWIYQGYLRDDVRMREHINYLEGLFKAADFHIQTEPVCRQSNVDLTTSPISRNTRTLAKRTRENLGIPESAKVVLITMGGIPEHYSFLDKLANTRGIHFIVPGASRQPRTLGNLVLLPHHSHYFHPDLVNASDAVIGKVGYSTLAEVYYAGVPFGYVARKRFRESRVLVSYIENQMNGMPVEEREFHDGSWLSFLTSLLAMPRIRRQGPRGAEQAARFIYDFVKSTHVQGNSLS